MGELDAWEPPEEIVNWIATKPDGTPLAKIDIRFEGQEINGPALYSVRIGYQNGQDAVLLQRQFQVPRWQSLNIMGILAACLETLKYAEICSDDWPHDQVRRSGGRGSAIPLAKIEERKNA